MSRNFNTQQSIHNWLWAALVFVIIIGGAVLMEKASAGTPSYYNPNRSVYSNADANAHSLNHNAAISGSHSEGGRGGSARQGQSQGQEANNAQGQSQGFEATDLANVNLDLSNHSQTHVRNPKLPAHQAYAPGLVMGGNEVCMGSSTAGGQGASFGFSIGSTWTDDDCVRRKDATFMAKIGDLGAARQLMCQKDDIAKAYESTGMPCSQYLVNRPGMIIPVDEPSQAEILEGEAFGFSFPDGN